MDSMTESHSGGPAEPPDDAPGRPRKLPADLPTSLNDRRAPRSYGGETEMYDAWQGTDGVAPRARAQIVPGISRVRAAHIPRQASRSS